MVLSRLKSGIKHVIWWLMIPIIGWLYVSYADSPRIDRPSEYQVKAAFLYSFANFVEWPSECFPKQGTPITIGVLGEDPFGSVLDATIQGKEVNGRTFKVKRSSKVEDLRQSHILFISSSEQKRIASILSKIEGLHILTVGEREESAKEGVIFSFAMRERMVRFVVNMDAAEKEDLKISSRVLKLAEIVGGNRSND